MSELIYLSDMPQTAQRGVVTIGNFDGVHLGHCALLHRVKEMARQLDCHTLAMTFDPHPSSILRPETAVVPLTTIERRAELLREQGIDWVIVCRTDANFLSLTDEQFFSQVIERQLDALGVVEGPNFFYGCNRSGNVETLATSCLQTNRTCEIIKPQTRDPVGPLVSSSLIRQLIVAGDLSAANGLLSASYQISGIVSAGDARGRLLGFPTANLQQIPVLVPGPGVYATRTFVDGKWRLAATHIGPNLTFEQTEPKVEVHILDYTGELYDKILTVEFVDRIREIAKFDSVEQLKDQLNRDIAGVRKMLTAPISD